MAPKRGSHVFLSVSGDGKLVVRGRDIGLGACLELWAVPSG